MEDLSSFIHMDVFGQLTDERINASLEMTYIMCKGFERVFD